MKKIIIILAFAFFLSGCKKNASTFDPVYLMPDTNGFESSVVTGDIKEDEKITDNEIYEEPFVFESCAFEFETGMTTLNRYAVGQTVEYVMLGDDENTYVYMIDLVNRTCKKMDMTFSEDEKIFAVAADKNDNFYIFRTFFDSKTGICNKAFIESYTKTGELGNCIDLKKFLENVSIARYCMIPDENLGVYLSKNRNMLVHINEDGTWENAGNQDSQTTCLSIDGEGNLYCAYSSSDFFLGKVVNGEIYKEGTSYPEGEPFPADIIVLENLLLFYNFVGGVYEYEFSTGDITNVVSHESFPLCGESVSGAGFLTPTALVMLELLQNGILKVYITAW